MYPTIHPINIREYLNQRPLPFILGFIDAVFQMKEDPQFYNTMEYTNGYHDGMLYRMELAGTASYCILRKVHPKKENNYA